MLPQKQSDCTMKISMLSVLALAILLLSTPSMAAIKGSAVLSDLAPCLAYLINGGFPSKDCCSGVSKLVAAASTRPDRRAACTCIVDAAKNMKPNIAAAKALPGNCGITLPVSISLSVDCSN